MNAASDSLLDKPPSPIPSFDMSSVDSSVLFLHSNNNTTNNMSTSGASPVQLAAAAAAAVTATIAVKGGIRHNLMNTNSILKTETATTNMAAERQHNNNNKSNSVPALNHRTSQHALQTHKSMPSFSSIQQQQQQQSLAHTQASKNIIPQTTHHHNSSSSSTAESSSHSYFVPINSLGKPDFSVSLHPLTHQVTSNSSIISSKTNSSMEGRLLHTQHKDNCIWNPLPLLPMSTNTATGSSRTPSTTTTNTPSPPLTKSTSLDGGLSNTEDLSPQNHTTTTITTGVGIQDRRQKRLERNRVSARESRRRRKQYLEVLEDKVTSCSDEMDRGRRQHVLNALPTYRHQRQSCILEKNNKSREDLAPLQQQFHIQTTTTQPDPFMIPMTVTSSSSDVISNSPLYTFTSDIQDCLSHISRSSRELQIANAFCKEYLMTLVLPSTYKFIMWLTLQNDEYFRGGRAPSERLSAARIGERILNFESDRAGPSNGMWPLFCHEINLSFDQEERVRNYQRQLLSNPESWMERHLGTAAIQMIQSLHHAMLGLMEASHRREDAVLKCLSAEQKVKFLQWSLTKREALSRIYQRKSNSSSSSSSSSIKSEFYPPIQTRSQPSSDYEIDLTRHDAVNLYILNYKFSEISKAFPTNKTLLDSSISFKKLGRRPTFESLGNSTSADDIGGDSNMTTCSSSSSLKRCSSEMSCDDLESVQTSDGMGFKRSTSSQRFLMDDMVVPPTTPSAVFIHTTPEAAQAAASTTMVSILDPIRAIIPSFREYEVVGFPYLAITPTISMERLSKASVTLKSIKSASSTNLLNRGISTINENEVNHKRQHSKQISQPSQVFLPSHSAPTLFGAQHHHLDRDMKSTETRTKAQAFIPPNILARTVHVMKQDITNQLSQPMEKDMKSLHDAFTSTLTGGSFLNDDMMNGNSLEDIALDLSSQELKNSDPLQCMVYDDPVLPIMSTLDDDLLLALATDDDWAIGEGLDMELS